MVRQVDPYGEPETEYFEVMAVRDLPPSEPFRADCMGENFVERRARPRLPFRKPCCDYHARDWAAISSESIRLLQEAQARGLRYACETYDFVRSQLKRLPLEKLDRNEVMFLFSPAIAIQIGPSGTAYTNGQHRGQAMRDLGVERTVVMRWSATPEE
jgi:hypothetical protein